MPTKRSLTLALALLLVAAIPAQASSLPTINVVDLAPGSYDSYALDGGTTGELGGYIFFEADDGTNGFELWRSNGTTTEMVKNIRGGAGDSYPTGFVQLGGYLYFRANDGITGRELWRTNGTAAGTTRVANINVGNGGLDDSAPRFFTAFGGFLYFQANDGTNGYELWRTNGTELGTTLVEDIHTTGGSYPNGFTAFGGYLYFEADNGVNGAELYRTNGTTTELVDDINFGDSSFPANFTALNAWLYFSAYDSTYGIELWRTNGTTTELVDDIYTGTFDSYPSGFIALGDYLYFRADDGVTGEELWRTNGATTELVENHSATGDASPRELTLFDGGIFMSLTHDTYGAELCVLDAIGADKVINCLDLAAGPSSTNPDSLTVLGDYLYFSASNLAGDDILYRIALDRTRQTITLPAGVQFDCDACDNKMASAGGRLYMTVSGDLGAGEIGYEFAYLIEPSYVLPETNTESAPISMTLAFAAALTAAAGVALRRKRFTSN